jgi:signal transduction histidine kinase
MVIGAFAVLAVAGAITIIAGRLSSAMNRLGTEVLRIARGDFSPTEVPARDDEIRELSLAINRTAELLHEYSDHVRQAEQMRTVSLLGAGLAHEMRNATTGCRIALDLHEESCAAESESLVVAKRQLQLMESQLQRFLRAGRSVEASQECEVDLAAVVANAMSLVSPAARHAGVNLEGPAATGRAIVVADGEALGQAVVNLLLNAIEAVQRTPAGWRRVVSANLNGGRCGIAELVVSDNGPGPQGFLAEALFRPFVTSKPEGIGLGLAVVKGIVEAHRGTINWSRVDGVTSFCIKLPLAKREVRCV